MIWGAGKNRPLDEDEMEFLDGIEERERAAQASMAAHEEQELQEYQLVSVHLNLKNPQP